KASERFSRMRIEAKVMTLLERHANEKTDDCHRRLARQAHLPGRDRDRHQLGRGLLPGSSESIGLSLGFCRFTCAGRRVSIPILYLTDLSWRIIFHHCAVVF